MTDGGDPSTRTIEQLRMAFEHSQDLADAKFENVRTELDAAAKAVVLLQERVDSQPTPDVLEQQILALKESTDIRFQGLKELATALAISNEKKLELALSSQQEAAKKAESSNIKLIDSLTDKLNDLKDRVVALSSSRAMVPVIITAVGAIVAIAVGIIVVSRGAS